MDDLPLEMTEIVVPTDPEISPVSYIDMLLSSFLLLFVAAFFVRNSRLYMAQLN